MSGPADLARLTVTIDKADELFLSEEIKMVDVGGGVMRPTNAKVLADLATQMSGALIYTSVDLGIAGTPVDGYFSVLSSAADEYIVLYRNNAGAAHAIDRYPNSAALENVKSLVQEFTAPGTESSLLAIVDGEGGRHAALTDKRLVAPSFELSSAGDATLLGDAEGGVVLYSDDQQTIVGPLEMQRTTHPGIFVTDGEGGVLNFLSEPEVKPSAFEGGLLFSPVLVTSELYDSKVYISGLLPRRAQLNEVSASIASTTTAESQTGEILSVSALRLGPNGVLNLRLISDPNKRRFLPVTLKNVPVQTVPTSPKILFIGDSIGTRQGAFLLKQYLEELGLTPRFIGTIPGSASASDIWNGAGPLGECHSGWRSGDFTYSATGSAVIIPPGGEAAYLALPVMAKRDRNPFLRAATGADDVSIIRNGYVFDPSFYQARFGLEAPDIVINALGTNDAYGVPLSEVYSEVLANDTLLHRQIKAAWPGVKIIRTLPTNALSANRNTLWETQFTQVIRALQAAAVAVANSNLTIAPLWAMTNSEVGYEFSRAAADADGFYSGTWTDGTHPIGSARAELYRSMAPYVAAAALNLI